jgi:peptidoglycan hydrolase CwlO-like protein
MRKYKMTGCARFFLVLIVLAPLAYIGASYVKGEDGIENIKNLLGLGDKQEESSNAGSTYDRTSEDLKDLQDQLEDRDRKIRRLENENDDLQQRIDALEDELRELKAANDGGGE